MNNPERGIEIPVASPSSSQDSNNSGDSVVYMYIDTYISKNISGILDVPNGYNDAISPLSCHEGVVGDSNRKIMMDV